MEEVIIHSDVTGLVGTTVLSADPEQTVGQLIRAFCDDRGIPHRLDLVLSNCRQEVLRKRRKLIYYNIRNGEELYISLKGMHINIRNYIHRAKCTCADLQILERVNADMRIFIRMPSPFFMNHIGADNFCL